MKVIKDTYDFNSLSYINYILKMKGVQDLFSQKVLFNKSILNCLFYEYILVYIMTKLNLEKSFREIGRKFHNHSCHFHI